MENKDEHHNRKYHLYNLPTLKNFPDWQGYSKFACLLIPIFSFDESTEHIENYVAKSAAWSLKTWKENSDAKLFNIPCYIYVESTIADAALPILYENGVPKDDIIVADYPDTEWLAKCLQPVFDKQFEKYEYIIISDADMFVLRGGAEGKRILSMFENIKVKSPKGFGCTSINQKVPLYWIRNMKKLYESKNGKMKDGMIDKWCEDLALMTNRKDLRKHVDGDVKDNTPWTGVMVIHNKTFTDIEWLKVACNKFGDDEAVIYTWIKFSDDNVMWKMEDIDIKLFMFIVDYIECMLLQACENAGKTNDVLFETIYLEEPCLLHNFASVDWKFYKALGVC